MPCFAKASLWIMLVFASAGCESQASKELSADLARRAALEVRPRYVPLDLHRGHYVSSFERSEFLPCGSSERWWVEFSPDSTLRHTLRANGNRLYRDTLQDLERSYLEFRGDTSALGQYGHMDQYDREVWMRKLIAVEPDAPGSCPH